MKEFKLLFCLMLLLVLAETKAQENLKPLSLQESISYAIENSPRVQTALLDITKNDYKVKEILSIGLPQVNINGQYIYNVQLATQLLPGEFFGEPGKQVGVQFGTKMNTLFTAEVNQMLFSKTFFIGLGATRKLKKLYEQQAEKTKDDLGYEIARLYYSIQITQKQQNILQANLQQVNRLLQLTQKQQENGFAKKIDVDQLNVNRINLENQLKNLALQVEQLKQALKFYMAMPLDQPIALTDTIQEAAYIIPDLQAIIADFSQKKDLTLLEVQRELNDLNVEQYRAGYWPSLYLFGNYNYQGQGNTFSELQWFNFGSVGLALSIPIFDGFKKKSQIQQAQIDQSQLAQARLLTEQSLRLQYNNAIQKLQTNINNLQVLSENRSVAEEVYRIAQNRFTEGITSITEVLSAETSMREAQTNYLTTLLEVKLAEIDLQHAKGTLLNSILNK